MRRFGQTNPLADLAELSAAANPRALHRLLVAPGGCSHGSDHFWVAALFRSRHAGGEPGALDTALLLCTDRRFEHATSRLVAEIAESGILSEGELDELAQRFLGAVTLAYEAPGKWLAADYVQLRGNQTQPLNPRKRYKVPRRIAPPLRRWAARHLLSGGDEEAVDLLLDCAARHRARDAAAIVSGMVDAAGTLTPGPGERVVEIAVGWPAGTTRLVALQWLAANGRAERARALALADRSGKVRDWCRKAHQPSLDVPAAADEPMTASARRTAAATTAAPAPTLFDAR